MKQKEFEMFLNFTKLLTNIMKEVAEINKRLTILSCRIPMQDSNPANQEANRLWQEILESNTLGEQKNAEEEKPTIVPTLVIKKISAILKEQSVAYERCLALNGTRNFGVRYYNAWPVGHITKTNSQKIAFLAQDICHFISKVKEVSEVFIYHNKQTSKRSIVVKFKGEKK